MCRISIIVPVYNVETYLRECLDSLIHQTYKNIEIILINDGSTDNSGKICDEYGRNDTRIKVFHIKNSGPSVARNYGLTKVTGEYIMFVDADDWIESREVEICYNTIRNEDCDVILFNLCKFNDTCRKECRTFGEGIKRFSGRGIKYLEDVLVIPEKKLATTNVSLIGSVCKFYKKCITEGCYFPENVDYGEDTCFMAQILEKAHKVTYIDNVFYYYRTLSDSLAHKYGADFLIRKIAGTNWILNFYKNKRTSEFLNEFCFKNYTEAVCTVYADNSLTKKEKKRKIQAFLSELDYEYDFSRIDYRCKNKKLQLIRLLIKYNRFFLLSCLLKAVKLKNRKSA